jgi:hypothetical protein
LFAANKAHHAHEEWGILLPNIVTILKEKERVKCHPNLYKKLPEISFSKFRK